MPPIVNIKVTLEGDQVIDRALQGLEDRISDAGPAWPAVLAVFRDLAKQGMDTEGGSTDAGNWAPLAQSTQRSRIRLGFPGAHPILQRSGKLYRAVTLESDSTVVQQPTRLAVMIDLWYFKFHQSRRPRQRLPRRAPLSFTQDQKYQLVKPLRLWFTGHDPDARIAT